MIQHDGDLQPTKSALLRGGREGQQQRQRQTTSNITHQGYPWHPQAKHSVKWGSQKLLAAGLCQRLFPDINAPRATLSVLGSWAALRRESDTLPASGTGPRHHAELVRGHSNCILYLSHRNLDRDTTLPHKAADHPLTATMARQEGHSGVRESHGKEAIRDRMIKNPHPQG